ncbi:GerMN domain-containing protein [Pseudarthrobacter sp. N5]|uniref:GerMN domain-containing protein n=1 Tax=Pseudarthrobacter sp. N5 TaxID=3418416 RepID=UPI003CF877DC
MPAPQPQPAPAAGSPANSASLAAATPHASPLSGSSPTGAARPAAGASPAATAAATGAPSAAGAAPVRGPVAAQQVASPGTVSSGTAGTAAYFVALDDGGSSGVRFGCNDSLVAVHITAPATGEPLRSALNGLLGGTAGDAPAGLYNALANSTLTYVSGYSDGTTVVVNLSGSVQPGGVCDIPRVEAQLTQTAVTAAGAVRAEIYIDGVRLADVLSLR